MPLSKNLIFSVIAGLLSALMAALALTQPGLLTLLIYVAAVPILFAGFTWGSFAGVIAAATAVVSTAVSANFTVALLASLIVAGPAALAGYLAGLSRPDDRGTIYWYPLSELLFHLSLAVAAGCIMVGLMLGYNSANTTGVFEQFMLGIVESQNLQVNAARKAAIKSDAAFYATLMPLILPAFVLAIIVWNMRLAERMARLRSLMPRPKDNIAADIGLPRKVLIIFAASIIIALLFPPMRNAALVVAGTTGMAIAMVGLAVLHYYSWGWKGRNMILLAVYIITIATSLPVIIFVITGITELLLLLRARSPNRMPPNQPG